MMPRLIVSIVLIIVLFGGIIYFSFFSGSSFTKNCVISGIGTKGITVEYVNDYGKTISKSFECDNIESFTIGDEVTVEFTAFNTRIINDTICD